MAERCLYEGCEEEIKGEGVMVYLGDRKFRFCSDGCMQVYASQNNIGQFNRRSQNDRKEVERRI